MIRFLFALSLLTAIMSCTSPEREHALNEKESRLQQWEAQLKLREQALAQKEEELLYKARQADSLSQDSTSILEPRLVGKWSAKMTCSETSCPGSAVGDTKSEIWEFTFEGNRIVAKAIVNEKVSRIYSGHNTVDGIRLIEEIPEAATSVPTRISVELTLSGNDRLEGHREIIRENECRILYTLLLNKQ